MARGSGSAEKARPTVHWYSSTSFDATPPGGNPMSIATTSPSPRGPSRKVGICEPSVPAAAKLQGIVEFGLPAVHLM